MGPCLNFGFKIGIPESLGITTLTMVHTILETWIRNANYNR